MPDEDPLDDLLGGHWVLAEDGEGDSAIEVLITEAAQARGGQCPVVAQQPQDVIPGHRGVFRRLPRVAFISGADPGRELPPRDNWLDESFQDPPVRAADMGADRGGRPSFAGTGYAQIGVTGHRIDHLLVDLFEPGCQFVRAFAPAHHSSIEPGISSPYMRTN